MRVPPHRVGMRQPAEELTQLVFGTGADDEVPMTGHHAVGRDGQLLLLEDFTQDAFKSLVIFVLLEQRQAGHSPIQDVKTNSSRANTGTTWHARNRAVPPCLENSCLPFFRSMMGFLLLVLLIQFSVLVSLLLFCPLSYGHGWRVILGVRIRLLRIKVRSCICLKS